MIMLVAAIATGLFFLHAVQAAPQPGQALQAAAMSMDDGRATGTPHGCPFDQKANLHGSCFAACATVSVLPLPTAAILYCFVGQDILQPKLDLALVGHALPPDPPPPKAQELS